MLSELFILVVTEYLEALKDYLRLCVAVSFRTRSEYFSITASHKNFGVVTGKIVGFDFELKTFLTVIYGTKN